MSEENSTQSAGTDEESTEEQNSRQTVLYCLTREALTETDLLAIRDALSDEGYYLSTNDDGDKISIEKDKQSGPSLDIASVLNGDDD